MRLWALLLLISIAAAGDRPDIAVRYTIDLTPPGAKKPLYLIFNAPPRYWLAHKSAPFRSLRPRGSAWVIVTQNTESLWRGQLLIDVVPFLTEDDYLALRRRHRGATALRRALEPKLQEHIQAVREGLPALHGRFAQDILGKIRASKPRAHKFGSSRFLGIELSYPTKQRSRIESQASETRALYLVVGNRILAITVTTINDAPPFYGGVIGAMKFENRTPKKPQPLKVVDFKGSQWRYVTSDALPAGFTYDLLGDEPKQVWRRATPGRPKARLSLTMLQTTADRPFEDDVARQRESYLTAYKEVSEASPIKAAGRPASHLTFTDETENAAALGAKKLHVAVAFVKMHDQVWIWRWESTATQEKERALEYRELTRLLSRTTMWWIQPR